MDDGTGGTGGYLGMWDDVMTVSHAHKTYTHTHTTYTTHRVPKQAQWTEMSMYAWKLAIGVSFGTGAAWRWTGPSLTGGRAAEAVLPVYDR